MFLRLLIATVVAFQVSSVFATTNWSQVTSGSQYYLQNNLTISNTSTTFSKGAKFVVTERTPLSMIKVEMFKIKALECADVDAVSELELYEIPQSNGKKITVGIELGEECELEVFVELKDLYSRSLFL
jgi:hypothetical protein